jgi:hypothetical protein
MTIAYSSNGITAAREPARKLRFQQERADGKTPYVMMTDLTRTTTDLNLAWVGTDKQAHNVRAKFPHTRTMSLVRYIPKNVTRRD